MSKGQLRSAHALLRRKMRIERGEFLAEGAQAVREAVRSGAAKLVVVGPDFADLNDVLRGAQLPLALGTAEQLRELSDAVTPQGIVAICDWQPSALADLDQPNLIAICAQIRDPGNLGTVIRCADAFGADAVIVTKDSVDVTNPKTVRASVGSIFHLPVITEIDFNEAIHWAAGQGLRTCATQMHGSPLTQLALEEPTAWVFGNEAWGLPAEHIAACDQTVSIPMWGQAESLNLSTAAAICLFTSAAAQRRERGQFC